MEAEVSVSESISGEFWLEHGALQQLMDLLGSRGFEIHGPVVRDGAVLLEPVRRIEELPRGWRDDQSPGRYRLEATGSERVFDVLHGHGGLKRLTFAPREQLLQIESEGIGRPFTARPTLPEPAKIAVLGVRACDLAALQVQDRVFLHDRYPDPYYASRRSGLLLIAVSCTRSVSTCFCTSMAASSPAAEVEPARSSSKRSLEARRPRSACSKSGARSTHAVIRWRNSFRRATCPVSSTTT
jgi:hypothetical protein